MNKFEAVLITSPELSSGSLSKEIENFKSLISANNGKIINEEDWGLRELAFNIKKFKKAFYAFFQIELDGKNINSMNTLLNQNDNILRYLFLKVDNHQELPTKLKNEKK
tara:strand:- start:522 stop:848 length:327 start_codon:yes stop_codon:yes gene_type:complete